MRRMGSVGRLRRSDRLEGLPASAERLEQIDGGEQQSRAAVVGADTNVQASALRNEQRQKRDHKD